MMRNPPSSGRRRWGAGLLALCAVAVVGPSAGRGTEAQEKQESVPEYVLKAGFLFNFAKYVEWPAGAFEKEDSPIRIGIIGKDPFGPDLEKTFHDRRVNGRGFEIRRYGKLRDLERCHILFVPRTEKDRVPDILKRVESWNTLTVGEEEGFALAGGILNILIEERRPKLEANPGAAEKAGLKIDSKLLKLAVIVPQDK